MKKELRRISFIICMLTSLPLFGAANITQETTDNKTLWFQAVNVNNLELIQLLVKEVGVNAKNCAGNTALHLALMCNHEDLIKLLIKLKADLSAVNNKMETPHDLAKNLGRLELLKKNIEESKDKSESTHIIAELMKLGKKKRKSDECFDKDGALIGSEIVEKDEISVEKKHKGIADSEKRFKCDQCDNTYKLKNNLIIHKRTHTGDKPFKCDQCNKTFGRKSNLSKHKLIHRGEKLFICYQCDKAFTRKDNLNVHKKKHLAGVIFKKRK